MKPSEEEMKRMYAVAKKMKDQCYAVWDAQAKEFWERSGKELEDALRELGKRKPREPRAGDKAREKGQ